MEAIEKAPKMRADVAKFDERIRRKQEELEKAEKRKMTLYEDLKDGIISKKEYFQLKAEYDRRAAEAEAFICSYKKEEKLLLESRSSLHEWVSGFKEYSNIQSLSRNAAVVMVKKVLVYSADRIEVIYNFEDEFDRCREYAAAYGNAPERKEAV